MAHYQPYPYIILPLTPLVRKQLAGLSPSDNLGLAVDSASLAKSSFSPPYPAVMFRQTKLSWQMVIHSGMSSLKAQQPINHLPTIQVPQAQQVEFFYRYRKSPIVSPYSCVGFVPMSRILASINSPNITGFKCNWTSHRPMDPITGTLPLFAHVVAYGIDLAVRFPLQVPMPTLRLSPKFAANGIYSNAYLTQTCFKSRTTVEGGDFKLYPNIKEVDPAWSQVNGLTLIVNNRLNKNIQVKGTVALGAKLKLRVDELYRKLVRAAVLAEEGETEIAPI